MAKITFSKLGLKKNEPIKTITFNDIEIEVKQYLPTKDKLTLIGNVLSNAANASENKFANPIHVDVFSMIEIISFYTNITFTDKQKEDPAALFDLLEENGLTSAVVAAIPEVEYNFLIDTIGETIESFYAHYNSALGIIEQIAADYSAIDVDADNLQQKIADPNNLTFLKDVMTKLG